MVETSGTPYNPVTHQGGYVDFRIKTGGTSSLSSSVVAHRKGTTKIQFSDPFGRPVTQTVPKGLTQEERAEIVNRVARDAIRDYVQGGRTVSQDILDRYNLQIGQAEVNGRIQKVVLVKSAPLERETPTSTPTRQEAKQQTKKPGLREQIIESLVRRQAEKRGAEVSKTSTGILEVKEKGRVTQIDPLRGRSLSAPMSARLDITQSPSNLTKAINRRKLARKEAEKKDLGMAVTLGKGSAADILLSKTAVEPIPTKTRLKQEQDLMAAVSKLPFQKRVDFALRRGESILTFEAREGLPRYSELSTVSPSDSFEMRRAKSLENYRIAAAKFSTETGYGVGEAVYSFKRNPVKTGLTVGAFAAGGALATLGLGALGVGAATSSAIIGGTATGGYFAIRGLRRPKDILTPEGLIATTTSFGTYAVGAKALTIAGKGILKAGTKTTLKLRSETYKVPKIETSRTTSNPKLVAEKSVALTSKGGKITQKVLEGAFVRGRVKTTVKSTPKAGKTVTFTKGTLTKNVFGYKKVYQIEGVQVGRQYTGIIRSSGRDVVLTKTAGGKLQVSTYSRGSGRLIGKPREIPFEPQKLSVQKSLLTRTKSRVELPSKEVDIDGSKIRPSRTNVFTTRTKGAGVVQDKGIWRSTKTFFKGIQRNRVFQRDVATAQRSIIEAGGYKTITIRQSDIKFAYNPSFNPNVRSIGYEKLFVSDKVPILVKKSLIDPTLYTQRTYTGSTKSIIVQETSRILPFRGLSKISSKAIGGVSRFSQKIGGLQSKYIYSSLVPVLEFGKPVIVETAAPQTPALSPLRLTSIGTTTFQNVLATKAPTPFVFPISTTRTLAKTFTYSRTRPRLEQLPRTRAITNYITTPTAKTSVETIPEVVTDTSPKTSTSTVTRTISESFMGGGGGYPSSTTTPYVPLPPPPIIVPPITPGGFGSFGTVKKRRKYKGRGRRYTPSLAASANKIYGKAPKILTGIEIRPITRGNKGGYMF